MSSTEAAMCSVPTTFLLDLVRNQDLRLQLKDLQLKQKDLQLKEKDQLLEVFELFSCLLV